MDIKWFGNSTFLIKSSNGKRILIDPIHLNACTTNYDFQPDLIMLSNCIDGDKINNYFKNDCTIIKSCKKYINDFISIEGIPTYSDSINGLKRGDNIIYMFEIDNLKFCHLGTLGHKLNSDIIHKLKNIDFLFIPIGGHFSLDGNVAATLSLSLNAKYIIPMLYKTPLETSYLDGPYKFISHMKNITKVNSSTIQTSKLSFDTNNSVIILTP